MIVKDGRLIDRECKCCIPNVCFCQLLPGYTDIGCEKPLISLRKSSKNRKLSLPTCEFAAAIAPEQAALDTRDLGKLGIRHPPKRSAAKCESSSMVNEA